MKKLITEVDVMKIVSSGKTILEVDGEYITTPLAKDSLRDNKIKIVQKTENDNSTTERIVTNKIALGCDHTGLELKNLLAKYIAEKGFEIIDVGTNSKESCDYPDFAIAVSKHVALNSVDYGVVIDATGIPSSITANKFPGIRAATCYNEFSSKSARSHNNANVLVIGALTIGSEVAKGIIDTWFNTAFEGGRHQRRLDKISQLEMNFLKKDL